MFTGIIKGQGKVVEIKKKIGLHTISIELNADLTQELEIGASISVDGVCLTLSAFKGAVVTFDVMAETLKLTTLGKLNIGDQVNIERSAKSGVEIGGHILSGHIDCTVEIINVQSPENNRVITFKVPKEFMAYIFPKGYVAINGASLTITNVCRQAATFDVWLIPETLRITTFAEKQKGDFLNMEVERNTMVIVETVRSFLNENFAQLSAITRVEA